jgi:hypothetical protein
MTADERDTSSLDTDAVPGSQGETDPGSQGDFTGAPMDGERDNREETDEHADRAESIQPSEPTRDEQGI